MQTILMQLLILGGIPILLLIIGFLAGRYLKPWIHASQERLARFQEIAAVADKITDEMLLMFPNVKWDNWLNDAVDKLISACELQRNPDVAKREILAQIMNKIPPFPQPK